MLSLQAQFDIYSYFSYDDTIPPNMVHRNMRSFLVHSQCPKVDSLTFLQRRCPGITEQQAIDTIIELLCVS